MLKMIPCPTIKNTYSASMNVIHSTYDWRKRVDEEDAMEGGLKGRISAGAEFYLSAKEKSAGGKLVPDRTDYISY